MADENKRIPELPLIEIISGPMFLPIYHEATDTTYQIPIALITATDATTAFTWDSTVNYSEDEVVSYSTGGGSPPQLYIATDEPGNLNQPPAPGSIYWTLGVQVSSSGIKIWTAGVYVDDEVFVAYQLDGKNQLIRLNPALPRPYNSSNILNEIAAGNWALVGERGYAVVNKVGHGFAVNKWLTIKSSNWNLCDEADVGLAKVISVINANTVLVVLKTNTITSSGLTPFATYYHTASGDLTTVANDNPAFIALSATEAVIYPTLGGSGGGGGGGVSSRREVFRFNSDLFTEDELSFRGLITTLSNHLSDRITSVTYEVRLDSSSSWTAQADLTAVQTWINSNITGSELVGTKFWIRCLATYGSTGIAENIFIYTPS